MVASFQTNCKQPELIMNELNLSVLTVDEFGFLEKRKQNGVYNHETLQKLKVIISKLKNSLKDCSKLEKKLYSKFNKPNFGLHLDKDCNSRKKIKYLGKVQISGKFKGEIVAQALLIKKEASVAANIYAEVVMCKGKVRGDISATYKVKIANGGEVKGDLHSPNFVIEKGAVFDGKCSMPNVKNSKPFNRIINTVLKKTG